jgi:Uncharacterized protein conserved in bacteria (DUF2330)
MKKVALVTFVFIIFSGLAQYACDLYADMGRVISVDAKVSEGAQKALILHNGQEELLILGTDLRASAKAGIIRFIPFPSEPLVSLAPENVFDIASGLIKNHQLKMLRQNKGGSVIQDPVSLRFHQKLGAHDVTVIKVNDVTQFRGWANNFFKKKGLPQKESYPEVESVVADYVKRGIAYFVFDFVELEGPERSIEPVEYRFKSKEFYYPLKTSNTFAGQGGINLIVICSRTIGMVLDPIFVQEFKFGSSVIPLHNAEISSSSKITAQELKGIYPDAEDFFKSQKNLYIQLINYFGDYYFEQDLIADIVKGADQEKKFSDSANEALSGLESVLSDLKERFPENNPGPAEFEKFESPEGKFSVSVPHSGDYTDPSGWERIDSFPYSGDYTVNGIMLEGPKNKDRAAVKIAVLHYADNRIKGVDRYINKVLSNLTRLDAEKETEFSDVEVVGRKGRTFTFTKLELINRPFEQRVMKDGINYEIAPSGKQVTMIRRYIVLPAAPGFYSFMYEAPQDLYEEYAPVFDAVVKSFECQQK